MGRAIQLATVAVLALSLAACGDGDDGGKGQSSGAQTETATDKNPHNVQGRSPQASDLVGIWRNTDEQLDAQLKADGTFAIDTYGDFDAPYAGGTYKVAGRRVTFTQKREQATCPKGQTWVWEVGVERVAEFDFLHVFNVTGGCGASPGQRWRFSLAGPPAP